MQKEQRMTDFINLEKPIQDFLGWVLSLDQSQFTAVLEQAGHHAPTYQAEKWAEFQRNQLAFAWNWAPTFLVSQDNGTDTSRVQSAVLNSEWAYRISRMECQSIVGSVAIVAPVLKFHRWPNGTLGRSPQINATNWPLTLGTPNHTRLTTT